MKIWKFDPIRIWELTVMIFGDSDNFERINDTVKSGGGCLDGDSFRGVELLALESELLEAGIEDLELVTKSEEAVATGFENSEELSVLVVESDQVFGDVDLCDSGGQKVKEPSDE